MAIRKTWMAAAAALLAAGLVMTGCPNGNNDDDIYKDLGVGGLDDLDPTVDQTEGTDILLAPGDNMTTTKVGNLDLTPTWLNDGVKSWEVKKGKLSFELEDPKTNLEGLSDFLDNYFSDDGSGDKWKVTVTGGSGKNFLSFYDFYWYDSNDSYSVSRYASKMDGKIEKGSRIEYIYADGDVTLSRGEVKDSGSSSDASYSWDYTYKAFTLELKNGWNLVQSDYAITSTSTSYNGTIALRIADKDVPWTVDYDDGTRSKGIFGKNR